MRGNVPRLIGIVRRQSASLETVGRFPLADRCAAYPLGMRNDPCTSSEGKVKKRWATPQAARFVADWCAMKDGKPRTTYQCPSCGKWHTATSTRKGRLKP